MSKEEEIKFTVINEGHQAETTAEPSVPEVVRETTEHGQVVWFNSAPKAKDHEAPKSE